jgi:hypothetical protein
MDSTDELIRSEILETMNTAQEDLSFLLTKMSEKTTELIFENPLHGDLDFSELTDMGFKDIEKIAFLKPGEVTNLHNLPAGIKILDCKYQLLSKLDSLPNTIEELYLTGNYFVKLDLLSYSKLRILHISENELEELNGIPDAIEEIDCEDNNIKRLDLKHAIHLTTLRCSNNPILVLENIPSSLTTLETDGSNYIEMDEKEEKGEKKKKQPRIDYLTSLYEYFRLKNAYESKVSKMKQNAFHRAPTKKQGAIKARAIKPPCIQCKRTVGTVFSRKDTKYLAVCGDANHPCPLNIQIYSGHYFHNDLLLDIYKEDMDKKKDSIIKQKMDTLFNYISEKESVKQFKSELEEYTTDSKMYADLIKKRDELHHNIDTELAIRKDTKEMYRIIDEIKHNIKEYDKSHNKEMLRYAVGLYKNELIPIVQHLRMKKYGIMETDISEDGETRLVQYKIPLHKMDFTFGEAARVIKFSIGST